MLKRVIPLLVSSLLLVGCCCYGGLANELSPRQMTRQAIDLRGVKAVEVRTSGDLIIDQTGSERLEIEADAETLRYLTADMRNGTLVLAAETPRGLFGVTVLGPIRYHLAVSDLRHIRVAGSGDVLCEGLRVDDLKIEITGSGDVEISDLQTTHLDIAIMGSGDVTVSGEARTQTLVISGSGDYDAGSLDSDGAQVRISGSGNATVWAHDMLDVRISGSGNCGYYGNPSVQAQETGSGRVRGLGMR